MQPAQISISVSAETGHTSTTPATRKPLLMKPTRGSAGSWRACRHGGAPYPSRCLADLHVTAQGRQRRVLISGFSLSIRCIRSRSWSTLSAIPSRHPGSPCSGILTRRRTIIVLREQRVLKLFSDDEFLEGVDYIQEASDEHADDSIKWVPGMYLRLLALPLLWITPCFVSPTKAPSSRIWSTHFPSDRKLWQDAADLEAREGDDISSVNDVLDLVKRDSLRRLHSLALVRCSAGHQNEEIEDALEELF
ncbi:hypothetical protein Z517_09408 [Fonsecaea pedrosoi CBS 271.37]|uniref:Uncharacterized protein n=1 Tax=Fonsecaea pedrosoi CBS 271.37 TaxID=1442368 RepID=A0A0D2GXB9_9EURO|nr:uncharacterized protein Z517_09408 [Fonsecaea pedrosoi CBS 271.37]KIW76964.1 hypothetical protein Z517_09408 [Fonsecaea pedrosoi CBS 271.37]